jgi:predicted ATPase/class 3 adenylate cyclase/DNA-binding CsgD family transcriptional regulator
LPGLCTSALSSAREGVGFRLLRLGDCRRWRLEAASAAVEESTRPPSSPCEPVNAIVTVGIADGEPAQKVADNDLELELDHNERLLSRLVLLASICVFGRLSGEFYSSGPELSPDNMRTEARKEQSQPSRHNALTGLPTGTVTFLMTDVEGSTRIWDASRRTAKEAILRHDRIVLDQVEKCHGQVVEAGREGDSILAAFRQASDAADCAIKLQRSLRQHVWPPGVEMAVRIAVHTGEAELASGHYVGAPLYRCARLMATAHGGQILISRATQELVADNLPDGAALRDMGSHRLRDLTRPEHVFQLTHGDLQLEFPPLRSAKPEKANLPTPLTKFVGRHSELVALRKLLSKARLVTVIGPGGIGKSRLANELARDMEMNWPDGLWWIDLTLIDDPRQVASAAAHAMHLGGFGPALDVVNSWLANKRALLVLDSCEHVLEGCSDLSRSALERCRGLTILATSREPIGIPAEARWRLASLAEADAMSLFEQRGQQVLPDFRITDSNRQDVAEICRRLGELPLAIELAAGKLGVMSEREISRQLVDSFAILSGRRSEPRHQTMTSTIDWSYRLLTESEAALFRRLSVFQGGLDLESAQAVCCDEQVPSVLEALTGLVEKSMLMVERIDQSRTRYRLLDVQGAYAEEKLRATDDLESVQKKHHDYFKSVMDLNAPGPGGNPTGADQERWKRRESGNVWAALKWARNHEPDLGLSLATKMAFSPAFDPNLARHWLVELLEGSPAQGQVRRTAVAAAAGLALYLGDSAEYLRLSSDLKEMAREAGDTLHQVIALHGIGGALGDAGQFEAAESAFMEAVHLLEGSEDIRTVELINNDLGCLALFQGRFQDARNILVECVASLKGTGAGSMGTLARTMESLASAELGCGELQRADVIWKEALATSYDLGDHGNVVGCLGGMSRLATARGDQSRALRLGAAHKRLSEEYSSPDQPWWREQLRRSQEVSRAKLGPARSEQAWREGLSMDLDRVVEYALEGRPESVPGNLGPLSRREGEVAGLVASGKSNRAIAGKLFISERTVEGHLDRIRNKLALHSRSEITRWAIERRLLLSDAEREQESGDPPETLDRVMTRDRRQ